MAPVKKIGPKKFSSKKVLKKKLNKKKSAVFGNRRGAVFLSNLPHGFYERALDRYLEQFGEILRIKVARSLRNAKPMGYAYVEFKHEKVALIVAKTMNNYLMFKKLLKCQFINHENLNYKMWANAAITPELCPGTIQKRKNQYILETGSTDGYVEKSTRKGKKMENYVKNTLGLKLVDENEENKKISMVLDGHDEEISIKTPPNVIKIRKNKTSSDSVRQAICDGDATTVKKVLKKRRSSSLEPVAKDLFKKKFKYGNDNKKLKLNPDTSVSFKVGKENERNHREIRLTTKNISKSVNSLKHDANLSKREPLSNAKLIGNMKMKVVSTPENKTVIEKRLINKSLKKVIDEKVSCSTNEENLASKKHKKKVTKKSRGSHLENKEVTNKNTPSQQMSKNIKIMPPSDDIQISICEKTSKNKTPKSSVKGRKVVLGNISASLSPSSASTNVIKRQAKGTQKSSTLPMKSNKNAVNSASKKNSNNTSNVNTPSQKLPKKAKVMPTPDNNKITGFAKTLKNRIPKSSKIGCKDVLGKVLATPSSLSECSNVSKKIPYSPKMVSPAQKVVLSEKKDGLGSKDKQRLDNRTTRCTASQKMINRRASLGIKKPDIAKTPKTNRVRSKQKIQLPVSV